MKTSTSYAPDGVGLSGHRTSDLEVALASLVDMRLAAADSGIEEGSSKLVDKGLTPGKFG